MAGSIQTWSNPLPASVGQDLQLIFESLTNWLANPTFLNGITVGSGDGSQTGDGSGVTTAKVDPSSISPSTSDPSSPNTPTITAVGGIRSILAYWPAILTANGNPVASYDAEVASDSGFTSIVETLHPVGPVASFDNLTSSTTYYVRVRGVSYAGNAGSWSGTATVTTPQVSTADIAANTITAGSAIIGTAAISSAEIASLAADKIVAGTINAQTVQLGASGGTAAIQSTNYAAGTTGWAIKGDGTAEFSNVGINGGSLTTHGSYVDGGGSSHFTQSVVSGGSVTIWDGFVGLSVQPRGSIASQYGAGSSASAGFGVVLEGGSVPGSSQYSKITLAQHGLVLDATASANNAIELDAANVTVSGRNVIRTPIAANAVEAGQAVVTTNSSGYATVNFPTAFSFAPVVVACIAADQGDICINAYGATTSGFTVHAYTAAGAGLASTAITVNWIALGEG